MASLVDLVFLCVYYHKPHSFKKNPRITAYLNYTRKNINNLDESTQKTYFVRIYRQSNKANELERVREWKWER